MTWSGSGAGRHASVGRQSLVDRLVQGRRGALFAPSGYGKSTLLDQLAQRLGYSTVLVEAADEPADDARVFVATLRRALRAAGLRLLAEAIGESPEGEDEAAAQVVLLTDLLAERDDPVLLVFDDVHRWHGAAADALGDVVAELPAAHHVVVAGHAAPGWKRAPRFDVELGQADLAFSVAEIAAYGAARSEIVDDAAAAAIEAATGGWPAAVALAVEAQVIEPRALRRGVGALVERVLAGLDPDTRALVMGLAQLPLLSDEVAAATFGRGALNRLATTGMPLRQRGDRWIVLADPVRSALAEPGALPAAAAAQAAELYLHNGEAQTAAALLLGRGEHEALAGLLEAEPWQELQQFDPVELRSLLNGLPQPTIDAHPRLLLAIARVAEGAAQMEWRSSLLARAAASPLVGGDAALRREIDAELASDASYDGDVAGSVSVARAVLAAAGTDEVRTRARALTAIGRALAFARDAQSMVEAGEALSEAAALLRLVDEPEWRAHDLLRLGYSVYFAEGDLDAALARTREAVDTAPFGARERATDLTFFADVLIYAGQFDEADGILREVADISRRLRDHRLLGYHAWMKAVVAARRHDAAALATWLSEAERHPGDWFDHPTGIEFLAEAVDMYGRIGDHELAARYLTRVEERCAADRHEGVDQIALLARAIHGARAGDPVAADADLARVLESEQLPRRETWRIFLLRGLAALRAGDRERASAFAARSFEEATALGHPEWPSVQEPHAYAMLAELVAPRASAAAAEAIEVEPRISVRVLGGFSVTSAGRPADPPPGRPTMLVKLLAVANGPVAIDEAVESLWPEIDPDTGRARMRNVLARVRAASGDVVRREGDALELGPAVTVDAIEFEREARAAIRGSRETDPVAARSAIARYAGELLPADRYLDFTVAPRERLALRYLALLDRLAAEAEAATDIDEALRLYDEAISAAPLDEHRYEKAAALALRSGRRRRAREILERARQMLADLGVPASPGLAAVARELRSASAR